MIPNPSHLDRFRRTLAWMRPSLPPPARLLDVGPDNVMASQMRDAGYEVVNTGLLDLDDHPEAAAVDADAATAFEIFEHLVNPLSVLRAIRAPRLFASVPMRLWFAPPFRPDTHPWDRHYHEFEPWQFDWLLEKGGWQIVRREQWTPRHTGAAWGLRPMLRKVTPRWYVVEAVRTTDG